MPKQSKPHTSGRGRPSKADKGDWGQITCVLRNATIEQLRAGAGSSRFGEFLQHHLDRFPLPSREQYVYMQSGGQLKVSAHYPKVSRPSVVHRTPEGGIDWRRIFSETLNSPEEIIKRRLRQERHERKSRRNLQRWAAERGMTVDEFLAHRRKVLANYDKLKELGDKPRKATASRALAGKSR